MHEYGSPRRIGSGRTQCFTAKLWKTDARRNNKCQSSLVFVESHLSSATSYQQFMSPAQQVVGSRSGGFCHHLSSQHAGDFFTPGGVVKLIDQRRRAIAGGLLRHAQMR